MEMTAAEGLGSTRRKLLGVLIIALIFVVFAGGAFAELKPIVDGEAVVVGDQETTEERIGYGRGSDGEPGMPESAPLPDVYTTTRVLDVHTANVCSGAGIGMNCRAATSTCGTGINYTMTDGDVFAEVASGTSSQSTEEMVSVEIIRVDTIEDTREVIGYDCVPVSEVGSVVAGPVVITVTLSEFQQMPINALEASAGPDGGWLPVNMVNVLYADAQMQTLETTILGTPVSVRAIPASFHWDLGDGNTITTTKPGKPFPSEEVTSEYRYEGWYDVTLTTTFIGQFSVNGGEWQDIDGTVEISSDPIPIFAKSFESRLVNGDVPVDEEEDPWIPERTADTEGPIDPAAKHRRI